MAERRKPIPVSAAVSKVVKLAKTGLTERISINDAYGRILGEDIIAMHSVPPFDRSPYDGFAIRAIDSRGASRENPKSFTVIETIGAGSVALKEVKEFEAVRIMTGAKIPDQCDAVVMQELAPVINKNGLEQMTIKRSFKSGENISFKGEDAEAGKVLIRKGQKINPGVIALLATFGYETIEVAKQPIIGVFATGSELLDVSEELQPGKIRNSNAYMLAAQIERAGAKVKMFGTLADDLESSYQSIKEALKKVDVLITTGGVSVGDFDFLPAIYQKLEAEVLFNKVAMRPGSVTTVAHLNGTFLFGLSGNPSACYAGFELFVRPVVNILLFSDKPHLLPVHARLSEDFIKPNPFTRFVRSKLSFEGESLTVAPSGFNKSSAVTSLAATDCLIVLQGGTRGFRKGDLVKVLLLESTEGSVWPWE